MKHGSSGWRLAIGSGALTWVLLLVALGVLARNGCGERERSLELFVAHQQAEIGAQVEQEIAEGREPRAALRCVLEHQQSMVFGQQGTSTECVLALREGDRIAFFARTAADSAAFSDSLPLSSEWAEPMRRALAGEGGTLVGPDYSGTTVLAAYGPLSRESGIVAKVDLSEVFAPYAAVGLFALLGLALHTAFVWVSLHRAQEAHTKRLDTERSELSQVLDNVVEAVVTIDERGIVERFNASAVKIFGFSPEEVVGQNVSLLMPEPLAAEDDGYLLRCLNGERTTIVGVGREIEGRRKDGSLVPLSLAVGRVDEGGRVRFVGTLRDLTEEKRRAALEDQLVRVERVEALATLAGGIAHDFNNLLTPIIGYSSALLDQGPGGEKQRNWLRAIHTAGSRARELVGRMMHLADSSAESGVIRLNQVLDEAAALLKSSLPRGVSLEVDCGAEQGSVRASSGQLLRMMVNLGTNSAHAMTSQGGTLRWALDRADPTADPAIVLQSAPNGGPYLRLTVQDTGVGMTPAVLQRMFDPFFTTKAVGEGTGLGLGIVRRAVYDQKGAIAVESEQGQGTTFRIYLPLATGGNDGNGGSSHG